MALISPGHKNTLFVLFLLYHLNLYISSLKKLACIWHLPYEQTGYYYVYFFEWPTFRCPFYLILQICEKKMLMIGLSSCAALHVPNLTSLDKVIGDQVDETYINH